MDIKQVFDVLVVGGGHSGTEAAHAAARMGANTILITNSIDTLGQMSCNPAIGGIGKSHLVREIDACDGLMATIGDYSGIQFRILNRRKGPAVRATRAQIDRNLYRNYIKNLICSTQNLQVFQETVSSLIIEQDKVCGVILTMGLKLKAKTVVITTGTFLGGKIHVGLNYKSGGRAGDPAAIELAKFFRKGAFRVSRLKTGTPPRLDAKTIDLTSLKTQPGDTPTPYLSMMSNGNEHPRQVSCYLTRTTEKTRDIVINNLHSSPIYSGAIESVGPRYCPSIEDKIVRFKDKHTHQIFLEPEGLDSTELYPNGVSTSLPYRVQLEIIRSIEGCNNAVITRPGYAIEYDYLDPRDLCQTLESKLTNNLYFAGQINGTTGYEEAGAQGLYAGVNAALRAFDLDGWVVGRDQGYIGVMVDDLITLGTQEPYRMFTSRAEYRLALREDNADIRFTEQARKLGLVSDKRWGKFNERQEQIEIEKQRLNSIWIRPSKMCVARLNEKLVSPLIKEANLTELLRRPEVHYDDLLDVVNIEKHSNTSVSSQVEISIKYEGYIERQTNEIEKLRKSESLKIPRNVDFKKIPGLSNEVKQKLTDHKPETLAQAARISGVTAASLSILSVYLKKLRSSSVNSIAV